jgi:uncharacterized protein (TIGR03118 family)
MTLFLANGLWAQHYTQTDLVSNSTDPDLVNPWGVARSSGSPWWVADQATGKSTLYNAAGVKQSLIVTIPGFPTGTVFNGAAKDFIIPGTSLQSVFLFVSVDGRISGWNPGLMPNTAAVVVADTSGASYTGATIAAADDGKRYFYAADFHNGRVHVFDTSFNHVRVCEQAFELEKLEHRGYAPFNIQNVGGLLFVTYAKQDAQKMFDVPGPGNGFVAAFKPDGRLVRWYEHGDWLSSPWGVALAPSDFGSFSHTLLIGMFGSGQIAAYDITTGRFRGLLLDTNGDPISISGLWGISFGSSANSGLFNTLYFAAGTNRGAGGLFGTLTPLASDLIQGNGQ